jgi:hypothetical protein
MQNLDMPSTAFSVRNGHRVQIFSEPSVHHEMKIVRYHLKIVPCEAKNAFFIGRF